MPPVKLYWVPMITSAKNPDQIPRGHRSRDCTMAASLKSNWLQGWYYGRRPLNFRKFKVALNPLRRIFLNFAKSWILCWLQFDNKKWGSPSLFLSYDRLKLKLRVFLAGHIVAMVTYCATKLTATCSPIIGQFVDTMILASTGIEWL